MHSHSHTLNCSHLLIYLDDLIIFSKNLKNLMRKEVQYRGHLVSSEGICTDQVKISKVKDWPQPTSRKEVLQFLGFAGYYRWFVEGYTKLAAPLYRLTSGDPKKKKKGEKDALCC